MINVNQLTAQLRMLPDAVLRRVAMMYKNDPYILPMVISEDMARKKLRAAGQAQAAAVPQAKVNDQAVASLGYTPEEMGIAGLAAPNMQGMADGGIAGYDEDSFAQKSEPVVRMAEGGVARYNGMNESLVRLPNPAAQFYSSNLGPSTDPLTEYHRQAYAFEAERIAAEKDVAAADAVLQNYGVRQRQADPEGFARAVAAKQEAVRRRDVAAKRYAQESGRLQPKDEAERAFKHPSAITADEAKIYSSVAPKEPPKAPLMPIPDVKIAGQTPGAGAGTPPLAPSAGTGAGAAPKDGGIYSLAGRLFDPIEERTQQQLRQMREGATRRGEAERKAFEEGKPKTKVGEGLEALLKKEAEGEAGEREQAKAMAIFNAGLAMMAGGSPRALENIAKGAMVGSGQYAEAIKDFKKAAKERQKMLASIEEARRAEARDDNKTALALMQRANDAESKMEMFALEAGTSLGLKKADLTGRLYGTQMEIGARERLGRLPSADVQLIERIAQEKKIPFSQAFEYVRNTSQDPRTRQQLMKDWSESLILQQKYKTAKEYADAQMGTGGGLSGAGIDLSQWGNVQKVGG